MLRLVRAYSITRDKHETSRSSIMSREFSLAVSRCLVNIMNVNYALEDEEFKLEAITRLPKEAAEKIYSLSFWSLHFADKESKIVTVKEDILSWDSNIANFIK